MGNTIEYDDNIDNGFDENADLSITKIKNQQKLHRSRELIRWHLRLRLKQRRA